MDKKILTKKGFTLVEMLVYVALMTSISLIVVQSVVVVLKSNRTSFAEANLRNAGYSAMEAMIGEIRLSETIDQASDGILQMRQDNGGNIVRFATSSDMTLNFYEGSVSPSLIGPITTKNVQVKQLIFDQINSGKSLAVKIKMQLETVVDDQIKTEWFYSTVVLRGSY